MKSPMVTNLECISHKEGYSEMQVLQSPAGYYIGTIYTGPDGFMEPGSRDSGYYATHDEAERALGALTAMGDDFAADVLRETP